MEQQRKLFSGREEKVGLHMLGRDGTIYRLPYILLGCAIIFHSSRDKVQVCREI